MRSSRGLAPGVPNRRAPPSAGAGGNASSSIPRPRSRERWVSTANALGTVGRTLITDVRAHMARSPWPGRRATFASKPSAQPTPPLRDRVCFRRLPPGGPSRVLKKQDSHPKPEGQSVVRSRSNGTSRTIRCRPKTRRAYRFERPHEGSLAPQRQRRAKARWFSPTRSFR